jgi:hypothetical protein
MSRVKKITRVNDNKLLIMIEDVLSKLLLTLFSLMKIFTREFKSGVGFSRTLFQFLNVLFVCCWFFYLLS